MIILIYSFCSKTHRQDRFGRQRRYFHPALEHNAACESGCGAANHGEGERKHHLKRRIECERREKSRYRRGGSGSIVHNVEHCRRDTGESASKEVGAIDRDWVGGNDICLCQFLL